jgi:N-acetylmuramoyl-L-alanine amidase
MRLSATLALALPLLSGTAHATPDRGAPASALTSAIRPATGPLAIDVVYPREGQELGAFQRNVIYGSVGTGDATLEIDGVSVPVEPNGAFAAFLAVPASGTYRLVATRGTEVCTAERRIVTESTRAVPPGRTLQLVPQSISPSTAAAAPGELVPLRLRATAGASARLLLPDGSAVPLAERADRSPTAQYETPGSSTSPYSWYEGRFRAVPLLGRGGKRPSIGDVPGSAGAAEIELTLGDEVLRLPIEVSVSLLQAGMDPVAVVSPDEGDVAPARALPGADSPYQWAFPTGTVLRANGERDGFYRVPLASGVTAWVDARKVRLKPPGTRPTEGTVGTVRVVPAEKWVQLEIAMTGPLPFRVAWEGRAVVVEIFGAQSRINWAHQGPPDPLVRRVSWAQPSDDRVTVRLDLDEDAWGWTARHEPQGKLVVRVRRRPAVDPARPLAGRTVAVDAGHPPGGTVGPTRLTEADAARGLAVRLARLLRAAGATVVETRPGDEAVSLAARVALAQRADAELLLSIHLNAPADGADPFLHSGAELYFTAPRGLGLARALEAELGRLGLGLGGVSLADYAVVRSGWFPSVLTEALYLVLPQHEAALRDPAWLDRIAQAHLAGVVRFLQEQARSGSRREPAKGGTARRVQRPPLAKG